MHDPKSSAEWKAAAAWTMREQYRTTPITLPVGVVLSFRFPLGRSCWRSRKPVGESWRYQKPDIDNLQKAIMDAATGVLWMDDSQVVGVLATKSIAAQGEAPCTAMLVFLV